MKKNELKSYDDLNQPETHSTEVLLSTIEELERTKRENKRLRALLKKCKSEIWYWHKKYLVFNAKDDDFIQIINKELEK